MTVTFFGHRQIFENVQPVLRRVLETMITEQGADNFYVGHQGDFDSLVLRTLKELKVVYPHITYEIVLAYLPTDNSQTNIKDEPTVYPDGLESVPRRFAIVHRNRWMIEHSDWVISYAKSPGGAAQFTVLAEKRGKKVIKL